MHESRTEKEQHAHDSANDKQSAGSSKSTSSEIVSVDEAAELAVMGGVKRQLTMAAKSDSQGSLLREQPTDGSSSSRVSCTNTSKHASKHAHLACTSRMHVSMWAR